MEPGGISQLVQALECLDGEALWQLTDSETVDRLTALGGAFHRLEVLLADTAASSDDRRLCTSRMGYPDSAALLANSTPLSGSQARQIKRRAHRVLGLGGLDSRYGAVETAYRDGTLAGPHAERIANFVIKYHERMPDDAVEAIVAAAIAFGRDPESKPLDEAIEKLKDGLDARHAKDTTNPTPPPAGDDDHLDSLHLSQTLNGRWRLDADLNKLTGEKLATALDSVGTPQTGHPEEGGDYAPRTPEQQRADQLDEFLTRALAADILPTKGGLTPRVTLTGDIAAFLGRPDLIETLLKARNTPPDLFTHSPDAPGGSGGSGVPDALQSSTARLERIVAAMNAYLHSSPTLAWSGIISDEVAAMVACDARVTPIISVDGKPVFLGRDYRTANATLRHYLNIRDRGCTFPGCRRPLSWCQVHHLREWADGGPTDPDNCVLVCAHHHRLLHRGEWHITMTDNETPVFTPPAWVDPYRKPIPANRRTLPTGPPATRNTA